MALLEPLKTLSLITVPFAVYFAWTKIGHKVGASYSWIVGGLVAPGIGTVTLINMKGRPLAIFEVHAVMDDLSISLKRFDPPLILKGMEAVTVDAERVSTRYLGSEEYEWKNPFGSAERIGIYLTTSSKVIRCRRQGPPSQVGFAIQRKLRLGYSECIVGWNSATGTHRRKTPLIRLPRLP